MRTNTTVVAALALLAAGFTDDTAAQAPPPRAASSASAASAPSPPSPVELDAVVVRSGTERDERRDTTASKMVVTRDDLNRYGDTSVVDVLGRVPGVTVSGSRGRGTEVRMGGLGGNYVAILINGEQAPPGFSLDSMSPLLIERIEVQRSQTADRSAQAIAGSINIILKQSVRLGQKDLKLTLGSEHGRGSAAVGGQFADRLGDKSYSLAAELRHETFVPFSVTHRAWTSPQGEPVRARRVTIGRDVRYEVLNLTSRLNWFITDRDTLVFEDLSTLETLRLTRDERYTTLQGSPAPFQGLHLTQKSNISTHRLRTSWERRFEDGAQWEGKLGTTYSKLDQLVRYDNLDDQGALQLRRDIDGPSTDRGWSVNGKYQWAPHQGHTVSAGWDADRNQRRSGRYQTDRIVVAPLAPLNLSEELSSQTSRVAAYVQDNWVIRPGWSSYLGARWEQVTTGGGDGVDDFRNRLSVFSPILQSRWMVPGTQADALRASLSRTYRMPSLFDLSPRRYIGSTDNQPTSPDTQGNPRLRPEQAWGFELGYEHPLARDAGLLAVNGIWRRIEDVIIQGVRYDTAQSLWIAQPFNSGDARSFSLELEARLRLRRWWSAAPALEGRASWARHWSTVDAIAGPDNRLAQQTPSSATLSLDWRPEGSLWSAGASAVFTGGGQVALPAGQRIRKSFTRQLDAYALARLSARTQVRLSLANLAHDNQWTVNTFPQADGAGNTLTQTTMDRRYTAVRLVLEHKL